MKILNLTQHNASEDQVKSGVVEPNCKEKVRELLTFNAIPTQEIIQQKTLKLAKIATESGCKRVMIGGAPFLMSTLEHALKTEGITPVYAFSVRESDEKEVDGKIIKTNIFKHVGFVEV